MSEIRKVRVVLVLDIETSSTTEEDIIQHALDVIQDAPQDTLRDICQVVQE